VQLNSIVRIFTADYPGQFTFRKSVNLQTYNGVVHPDKRARRIMIRFNRRTYIATSTAALLIAAAILYADIYVAPATSAGSQTSGSSFVNVGQTAVGLATDGTVTAHIGAIRIYALSTTANVPGNCGGNATVNLVDYRVFGTCMVGPVVGPAGGCQCADIDNDGDADMYDYALFLRSFGRTGGR
jgi:hypothetical protein